MLIESPAVAKAHQKVIELQNSVDEIVRKLRLEVDYHEPIDQSKLDALSEKLGSIAPLIKQFIAAGKADVVPPRRGLFSSLF
jgi:phosphoenolpyruvate carboxylase